MIFLDLEKTNSNNHKSPALAFVQVEISGIVRNKTTIAKTQSGKQKNEKE
jgi:hypothetical protein